MTPDQDRLVLGHLNLVSYTLSTMPGVRAYRDQGGLRGAGNLGLVQAAAKYELRTGVPFRYYALTRIRGAILDELRSGRFGSRSVMADWVAARDAREDLLAELSRDPTKAEVAERLGWTTSAVDRAEERNARARLLSMDVLAEHGYAPVAEDDPTAPQEAADVAAMLQAAIAQLKPRLQLVVDAVFFAGQQHRQVAEALDVTESRISQMYREALAELRRIVPPELLFRQAA